MSEQLKIHRTPLDDAKEAADAAFKRLGDRMEANGFPRKIPKGKLVEWTGAARMVAPNELAEMIKAFQTVSRMM